jgi:NAD(P)-dependent dehydrogenase (short-subunit alcohol dehydrogenase family)
VLPAMRDRRSGLIVQISSAAGRYVLPARGSYAMSKWALEAQSDTYRIELVQFGIDVVTMELGPFDSDFQEARGTTSDISRSAHYPHVARSIQHSDAMREAHPERFLNPSIVGQTINQLIAAEPRRRPWRVVVHPLRDWLVPYNETLEALQRHVLGDRGFAEFVPEKSDEPAIQ